MSQSLHRLVRSQILFREVNERIRETIGGFDGPIEFLCECSHEICIETVTLELEEYERVRASSNLFLIVPGHELLEIDRVIDQGTGYILVEKIVDVEEVTAADPRASGGQ
jgi:hypothetical protein